MVVKLLMSCDLLATANDIADNSHWTLEKLQAYIAHVKTITPVTTEPANQLVILVAPPLYNFLQGNVKILPVTATN